MKKYSLDKARADGWLDQLGQGSQGFHQLCDVVGKRFVAFSVIAGIRITALTLDPRNPNASIVDFSVGDGGTQRLPLGEFRERLAEALVSDDDIEVPAPSGKVSSDELQAFIGFRYVLLAPIFDIGLEELRFHDDDQVTVEVTLDDDRIELSIEELREEIKERVRVEAERHRDRPSSPFAIDLNIVPTARAATSNPERVTELLGAWPGPLSLLLRTAEGQSLAPDVRATLAEALGLLGSAYVDLGRHEWAQEVLRLAIQWGQDQMEVAADLFRRLGGAYVAQDRHGEAIGILRRALALGAPRADVLPILAECFIARERRLPALLCAEDAIAAGASADKVKKVRERALASLGEDWKRFRRKVPSSSATR